jgi:hypothetical protein
MMNERLAFYFLKSDFFDLAIMILLSFLRRESFVGVLEFFSFVYTQSDLFDDPYVVVLGRFVYGVRMEICERGC